MLTYLLIAVVGLIPTNTDFQPTPAGLEIFVFSGEFHSDIILPLRNDVHDWDAAFKTSIDADTSWATHIAIGWGDKDFYINTPSWKDLKLSTACDALLIPSDTVMHVSYRLQPQVSSSVKRVCISTEQYNRLVAFIVQSFKKDENGNHQLIAGKSYHAYDAFFKGEGSYHAFRTCNCWVGDALKQTGIKTGRFTPFPKTVFRYFP